MNSVELFCWVMSGDRLFQSINMLGRRLYWLTFVLATLEKDELVFSPSIRLGLGHKGWNVYCWFMVDCYVLHCQPAVIPRIEGEASHMMSECF